MSALLSPPIPQEGLTLEWGATYHEFLIEAGKLVRPHWDEVGAHKDILHLDPDHERYRILEREKMLHILLARDNGRVVGYFALVTLTHPRDRQARLGTDEAIYISPAYRKHRLGPKMYAAAEAKCRELGVHILLCRRKVRRKTDDFAADLRRSARDLEREGFHAIEIVCAKVISDPHPETTIP